jgi:hypothetical protein
MSRGNGLYLVVPLIALALSSCRIFDYEQRAPWRAEAEEKCLAEKIVQPSAYMEPESEIDGRGVCGMTHPFKVMAMNQGYVTVQPAATLACPVIGEVDRWIAESVQPQAMTWFGEQVVGIHQISSYSCRGMNGQPGAHISEHAFGNALDIASFKLASGREIVVKTGWKGSYEERGFLRDVLADACDRFTTVLGPGANVYHYDHFHLDLMRHASGRSICKPAPQRMQPRMSPGVPMVHQQAPRGPAVAMRNPEPRYQPQPRYSQHSNDLPLNAGYQQPPVQQHTYRPQPPMPERQPYAQPASRPLDLAPQQPYASNPPMMQTPPAYQPVEPRPVYRAPDHYRLVPPANVGARLKSKDEILTGSISKKHEPKAAAHHRAAPHVAQKPAHAPVPHRPASVVAARKPVHAPVPNGDLFSPQSVANQKISAEPVEQRTLRALSKN